METVDRRDQTVVLMRDIYRDLSEAKKIIKENGYASSLACPFSIPIIGDTYLTPEGKIVTKQDGDKGPYGPRLIVVEMLTESERTYGKGIKTGEDALAKVKSILLSAHLLLFGRMGDYEERCHQVKELKVSEFRRLTVVDKCCYISRDFGIFRAVDGWHPDKPVYIVERKLPRKKRVLVLDYEEAMSAMNAIRKWGKCKASGYPDFPVRAGGLSASSKRGRHSVDGTTKDHYTVETMTLGQCGDYGVQMELISYGGGLWDVCITCCVDDGREWTGATYHYDSHDRAIYRAACGLIANLQHTTDPLPQILGVGEVQQQRMDAIRKWAESLAAKYMPASQSREVV